MRRLRGKEMPETRGLMCLGSVVERCWTVEFTGMEDVVKVVEEQEKEDE